VLPCVLCGLRFHSTLDQSFPKWLTTQEMVKKDVQEVIANAQGTQRETGVDFPSVSPVLPCGLRVMKLGQSCTRSWADLALGSGPEMNEKATGCIFSTVNSMDVYTKCSNWNTLVITRSLEARYISPYT
jgi:hypothetical protein